MKLKLSLAKFLLVLGAFVLFGAHVTPPTHADTICLLQGQSTTYTYTSSFGSAGSATATFTLSGNTLIVNYTNTSSANTYLSGIALNTIPATQPSDLPSAGATAGWAAGPGPGGGMGNWNLIAYGKGNKNRLSPGATGTAVFVFANPPGQLCIDPSIAHLTSLPNGQSEKPVGVGTPPDGGGGQT